MRKAATLALISTLGFCSATACKSRKSPPPDIDHQPLDKAKASPPKTSADGAGLDLYGQALPKGAVGRLGSLRMFDRDLRTMVFTPSGSQAVSTHKDGFQLWDLTRAERGALLSHESPGRLLSVSPDGKRLVASTDDDKELALWDLASGELLVETKLDTALRGLCFLDSDKVALLQRDGQIKLLPVGTEGAGVDISAGWKTPSVLACNSEAGLLAVGTEEGGAWVVTLSDNTAVQLGEGAAHIRATAISTDGKHVAFGTDDAFIYLYSELKEMAPAITVKQAHERKVTSLAFVPDSKRLLSSGGDWWFRQWNIESGELSEELPGIDGLDAQLMALSPDGSLMLSWSEHSGERGSEAGRFWLWNAGDGSLLLEPERHRKALSSIAYSEDGERIVTTGLDRNIILWDAQSTKALETLDDARGPVQDASFGPGSTSIYSAGADALVREWELSSGKVEVRVDGVGGAVNRLLLTRNGARAFTGDQIGRVWWWDLATQSKIQALDRRGYSAIYDLALSPDESMLAIAGSSPVARVVNLESGQELVQLNPGDANAIFGLAFSPNGKWLATAGTDHKIQLWKTDDWSRGPVMEGHDGTVRCVAFSSDGAYLVSGGNDELVKVWSTNDGRLVAEFSGHDGVIVDVATSPDGKSFASASDDRTALLWNMPSE